MRSPCEKCEKKGCGIYHDLCPQYQEWKEYRQRISDKKSMEHLTGGISRDHELKYRLNLKRGKKKS